MNAAPIPAPAPHPSPAPATPMLGVPMPLAQALVTYLSQQQYAQVAGLINGLQQCETFNTVENVP